MKVYLFDPDRKPGRYWLGDFKNVTIDSGEFPAFSLVDTDSYQEIARFSPGGWRKVDEGTPVGPYYKHCDIEES